MPRIVDHDQRRAELGRAAMHLVCSEGVAALSVRNLARESGWSVGAVRHYLPTQRETVELTCNQVREAFGRRIRAVPECPDAIAWLREALRVSLPLDQESRELSQVWLAFMGAEVHRGLGAEALVYDELSGLFERLFEDFAAEGRLLVDDPRRAAVALQATFDGLTLHLLLGRLDECQAMAALDHTLAGLVGIDDSAGSAGVSPR